MSGKEQEERARLLAWYDQSRRILPWREDPTPYHVWLSEIMLQQTRVEAVRGYYERFLAALPDIPSLAAAGEEALSKLWEGLGYYSRVRNLKKAAQVIVNDYGGKMPGTREELRKLPGIGPYTSAAIASIAFGEPVPAVDGNLQRIFARRKAYEEPIKTKQAGEQAERFFAARISKDRPGDTNQALMDLGAMICLPNGAPHCEACPWEPFCLARHQGRETALPIMPAKIQKRREEKTVFLISCGDRILLHKREETGLLAGLWEFPNEAGHLSTEEAREVLAREGLLPLSITPLPPARHVFTHLVWEMTGYRVELESLPDPVRHPASPDWQFAGRGELAGRYAIPSAFSAFRERILKEPSLPR